MDKRPYEPGTPDEVIANMLRVARQKGRIRKLFGRRGGLDLDRLEDVQRAAEELAASGSVVGQVLKVGFSATTPHEDATEQAVRAAREYGTPITAEVVETDEHRAAGEFLVKVLVVDVDPRQRPSSQRPGRVT
ncbi:MULTISPECIES: hypothetical protein [unclassified Nonomuraea]|uniref:hypothetical protein n=1 Tax=unclassified Nonomuraea TaxID=2593643 RepID=UPI0033E6CCE0